MGPPREQRSSLLGVGQCASSPPTRRGAPHPQPLPTSLPTALPSPVQLEGWCPLGLGHPGPGSPSGFLVVRSGSGRISEGPQHSDPGWGQVSQGLLALLLPQGPLLPRGPAPFLTAVPAGSPRKERGSHPFKKSPAWAPSGACHPPASPRHPQHPTAEKPASNCSLSPRS